MTHFSDYLRISLLEKYGGAWIDITLLLTEPLDITIFNHDFYSFNLCGTHHKPIYLGQEITQCKWAGFMLATQSSRNPLFTYMKNALDEYWTKYNYPIDYFMLNCLFKIAYDNSELIHSIIKKIPVNNENLYELQPILNDEFNETLMLNLKQNTQFFKVTQKQSLFKEIDGRKTFYGYIYDLYQS